MMLSRNWGAQHRPQCVILLILGPSTAETHEWGGKDIASASDAFAALRADGVVVSPWIPF